MGSLGHHQISDPIFNQGISQFPSSIYLATRFQDELTCWARPATQASFDLLGTVIRVVAEKTVYEEISGGADTLELGKRKINARGYCSSFNFAGFDQQKKVGVLSGGERNRVHLAKTLTEGANVLLLDEPTNDLDVNTLRALEEAIEESAGTALVVSHDRWFLDCICTHLIVFEGDSVAKMYIGNWSDYETMMTEKFGKDLTPHRVKYRMLKR
jgi:ATPase subunit of ABC transporter with duplicated ATPase domains